MSYDPRPRRTRRKGRGHRKGVEPAGLKRWRLSHRKLDPRPKSRRSRRTISMPRLRRRRHSTRPFSMPRLHSRRRYDPAPRTRRRFGGIRSYGGKIERGLSSKWGSVLGGAVAALYGVYGGMRDTAGMLGYPVFSKGTAQAYGAQIYGGTVNGTPVQASISNLWKPNAIYGSALNYLCYRFIGYNPSTKTWSESAWVAPFWASVAGLVGSMLPLGSKAKRIQKPMKAIALGGLIASTIGALALPATNLNEVINNPSRQTSTDIQPYYQGANDRGSEANQAAQTYLASGNKATGGTRRFLIAV